MMCFGVKERKRAQNHCVIVLLDDTQLVHEVLASSTGQDLLDVVIKHLNLLETSYFGLRYLNHNDQLCWLDVTKSASKQLKDVTPMTVYFGVKFYATDPCKLVEEITRYQFFLQIKQDILQARLPVSFELSVELFALAVQSELGDYDPQRHLDGYVGEFQFVPNQTVDLEKRAAIYHRNHLNGQVPATAELNFLERVKWLDLYGCHLIPIQYENCDEYALGLGPTGILVLRNKFKVAHYLWPRIVKGKCQGRCFLLDVVDKNNEKNRYGFRLANKDDSRQLKESVCLHKEFFQLTHSPNSLSHSGANQASQRLSERFRNSIRSAINIGSHHHHQQQLAGSSGSLSSKKSAKLRSSSKSQQLHYMQQQHQASQRSLGSHSVHNGSIVGLNTDYNTRQQPTVVRMPSRRYSNRDISRSNGNLMIATTKTNQTQANNMQPTSAMAMAYNMNIGKSQTLKATPTQKMTHTTNNHKGHYNHYNQTEMASLGLLTHSHNNGTTTSNVAIVPPGRHIVQPSIYKASSIVNGMHTIGATTTTNHTNDLMMQQFTRSSRHNSSSVNPSPRSVRSQRLSHQQQARHSQSNHDSLHFVSSASAGHGPAGSMAAPGLPTQAIYPVASNTQLVGPLYPANKLIGAPIVAKTNQKHHNNKQQQQQMQNDTLINVNNNDTHHSNQTATMTAYMPPPPPAYSGPRPQQLQQQRHLFSDSESELSKSNSKLSEMRHNNNMMMSSQSYHHHQQQQQQQQHHGNHLDNRRDRNNNSTRHNEPATLIIQNNDPYQSQSRSSRTHSASTRYLNNSTNDVQATDRMRGPNDNRHQRKRNHSKSSRHRSNYDDDNEAILNSNDDDDDDDDPSGEDETLTYNGKPVTNSKRADRVHHDSYDSDTYYSDDCGASSDDDQSYRSGCSSTNDLMNSSRKSSHSNRQTKSGNNRKSRCHSSSHKQSHHRNSSENHHGKSSHHSRNGDSYSNRHRDSHHRDRSSMKNQQQQQVSNLNNATSAVQSNATSGGQISSFVGGGNQEKLNGITSGISSSSQQHSNQLQSVDSQWKAIQERHNKFQQNRSRYLIDGLDNANNSANLNNTNNSNKNTQNNGQSSYAGDSPSNDNSINNNGKQPQVNIKNIANKQATPIVMAMNHFFNQNQQTNQQQQQKFSSPNSAINGFDSSLTDATQSNVSSPSISLAHNQAGCQQKSLATGSTSTTTSGYYGGSNSIGSGADSDSHTTVDGIGNGSTGGSSLNSNASGPNQSAPFFNGTAGLIESSSIKLMKSLAPNVVKNNNINNIFSSSHNRHMNTNHSAVNNWQIELNSDMRRCSTNNHATDNKNHTSSGIMKQTHNNYGGKSNQDKYHDGNNKHERDSSPILLSNNALDRSPNMFSQNGVAQQTNGHLKYVSFDV